MVLVEMNYIKEIIPTHCRCLAFSIRQLVFALHFPLRPREEKSLSLLVVVKSESTSLQNTLGPRKKRETEKLKVHPQFSPWA